MMREDNTVQSLPSNALKKNNSKNSKFIPKFQSANEQNLFTLSCEPQIDKKGISMVINDVYVQFWMSPKCVAVAKRILLLLTQKNWI